MSKLVQDCEPGDVGFDAARLGRIERHFARYVDDGRLAGWQVAIARHGRVCHVVNHGMRDKEAGAPIEDDTLFRIYSMSKPITSVAAMILHEEGGFELKDPVASFIPSFADTPVFTGGTSLKPVTVPQTEPMRMWHLLTHTSGLTYGFHYAHPVDARYREAGFDFGHPEGMDLEACCEAWAQQPLLFQPGSEWNYSVSTDVLGRAIEVIAGQPLDVFLRERVFEPLGMTDTSFSVAEADRDRLAALYVPGPDQVAVRWDPLGDLALSPPSMLSGGGGLVSTTADYLRFADMVRRGGELDGARILGPRTLATMRRNHLPGGADLEEIGRKLFAETTYDGVGFGLGFSVTIDPVKAKVPGSVGDAGWGGAASTTFWVDPVEDLVVTFMTQLLPSSTHPIRSQLKQLVHQALAD